MEPLAMGGKARSNWSSANARNRKFECFMSSDCGETLGVSQALRYETNSCRVVPAGGFARPGRAR